MVGGRPADFARAEPLLRALGRPVHVGGPGAGQAAKLCNNLIACVTMAAVAEACALAQALADEQDVSVPLAETALDDYRAAQRPASGIWTTRPCIWRSAARLRR